MAETLQKDEFNKKIYNRINNLITDYKLIEEGDKIAIA